MLKLLRAVGEVISLNLGYFKLCLVKDPKMVEL